ncbi:phosphoglycerate mutase family protein [Christiangramia sp. SM2212]|uniref:Phosphoglycerate mutase family protein n=1 Tax=Christiangramia sediminicola TaxID=3073267 RepID=A0ABU1EQZ5_9FLAO|nr:phosphoglycerate mutase family protein [Christiangramia sp. SM2212]MDR5590809.1 phosphoglycerate mutase family protein [Christiangramia sp. SM2212]
MANIITLFLSLILSFSTNPEQIVPEPQKDTITTYYLIRHAEKDRSDSENHDPNLTDEGLKRAENWAQALKDIDLDAVYSTTYNRTMQTAKPAADMKSLEIQNYDANKLFDAEFKKATSGKTVLVVGHSNTTPQFANAILGEKKYENIDDSENGALFIVQILEDGSKISQVIYIN